MKISYNLETTPWLLIKKGNPLIATGWVRVLSFFSRHLTGKGETTISESPYTEELHLVSVDVISTHFIKNNFEFENIITRRKWQKTEDMKMGVVFVTIC